MRTEDKLELLKGYEEFVLYQLGFDEDTERIELGEQLQLLREIKDDVVREAENEQYPS
jgi:hypothetical protein